MSNKVPFEEQAKSLLLSQKQREKPHSPQFAMQRTHLTVPATVWKYIGSAVSAGADLVMLDLEDSIPRGDEKALHSGRENIVNALRTLDWGRSLRFFRPRGLALDPAFEDIQTIFANAGNQLQGLIWPKAESAEEIRLLDSAMADAEQRAGLAVGSINIGILIESVLAEEAAFAIAAASPRITSLIFGAFDYFSSLRMVGTHYRFDHPLVDAARMRIAKAAASVHVPAIAEMTVNFPTKNKSADEQKAALAECRRDALHAKNLGFRGKWVGIPPQVAIAHETFGIPSDEIARAIKEVRAFQLAEREGRGAIMMDGKMADRATDRLNRALLSAALAEKQLPAEVAVELSIGD